MSINKEKILAIVPARKGSKRLPDKNIKELYGKPLVSYTIDEALKSKYIDKIVVNTNDKRIIDILEKYKEYKTKKIIIINRPDDLAKDDVPTQPVLVHTLKSLNHKFKTIVILQVTSPLRTVEDIDNCINIFIKEKSSSLMTVKEIDPFNIFVPNGAIFITSDKLILKKNRFKTKDPRLVVMPAERSVDIDTEVDFLHAKAILGMKK